MKRVTLIVGALAAVVVAPAPAAAAPKLPAPPVHPDTLPTLIDSWTLPASLAAGVTNTYAPRMAIEGDTLFVFDHHGRRLVAVAARKGKVKWHSPVPARSDRAFAFTPFVHGSSVYVANDGFIYAFDSKGGKLRWRLGLKGPALNGAARAKHRIFVPWVHVKGHTVQPGVQVWGIDSRNGRVEWSKKFPGLMAYVRGNADGAYYVGDNGVVLGLTPDRGTPRWQLRVKGDVLSPPILSGQNLYITTRRREGGWSGTGVFCVDVKRGKLSWQTKLSVKRSTKFLHGGRLVVVGDDGVLQELDGNGKPQTTIKLAFGGAPTSLKGAAIGDRAYVFSSDAESNGFVSLVDLKGNRLLATANALDQRVRSMVPAAKMIYLDGYDGNVYSFRLDRSRPPKRRSVPASQFAEEMLAKARRAKTPIEGLAPRLAGLGVKALKPIESALADSVPHVAATAADAIALLRKRSSVPALLKALKARVASPASGRIDPAVSMLHALAAIRDGRATTALAHLMSDAGQSHPRRRGAYVALGAIGTPAALSPIWALRGRLAVNTTEWQPQYYTASMRQRVEADYEPEPWPPEIRKRTSRTIQASGQTYTAALSPYLGGYNDVWVGESDLEGAMADPLFTGLTKAEVWPGRRIRIKQFSAKDGVAMLQISMRRGKQWISSRQVKLSLADLAADADGDKLPDIVERRLRLCVTHPDCDGDGVKDSEDVNPLASGKLKLSREQRLFQQAFFAYYAFLKRRGLVVVDPGDGPSFELYGRRDPIISLRRPAIERLRKEAGLHAADYVSFGGPYPEGDEESGSGDALPKVTYGGKGRTAKLGMDIVRAGNNAVAYNVTLRKVGKNWVVTEMDRVWSAGQ